MFGSFRFLLATIVVVFHLAPVSLLKYIGAYYGFYAVFGFYCVSGYLMTAVLQKTYGYDLKGSVNFLINRILRIFPSYYAVAVLAYVVISAFPQEAARVPAYRVSLQLADVLGNLLLFPFEFYKSKFRLIPPSWSIGVEILAYFLLWLFISRGKHQSLVSFIASLGYVAYTYIAGLSWGDRYFPLSAALLPFSIGAMMSHYLPEIKTVLIKLPRWFVLFSLFALMAHLVLAVNIGNYPRGAGLYVNLALMAFVIAQLAIYENDDDFIKKADVFLGNLSYPLFLSHTLVGFVVSLEFASRWHGLSSLIIGYPVAVIVSIFINKYVDAPVQTWRNKFRSRLRSRQ